MIYRESVKSGFCDRGSIGKSGLEASPHFSLSQPIRVICGFFTVNPALPCTLMASLGGGNMDLGVSLVSLLWRIKPLVEDDGDALVGASMRD